MNLTRDIYQKLFRPNASDRKLLNLSRVLALVVAVLATTLAIAWPEALGWLVASYAYSASGLLFPLFLGYALRETRFLTAKGAVAGVLCGFVGCGVAQFAGTELPYVLYGLSSSLAGLITVSLVTHPAENDRAS